MQRIKKKLDQFNGAAAQKPHSDKKRTFEIVIDIQDMINDNYCQSIRSIARDMGVSEFLIQQVVHADIQYFLFKMKKDQFLSQAMKDKRKL